MSSEGDDTAARWAGGDFVLPAQETPGQVLLCQACTLLGHCRLGLRIERPSQAGAEVETELQCSADHEGGPGVAHGGWIASVLDEIAGHVPLHGGVLAVTATLTVNFLKPVPIDVPLIAHAAAISREDGRWQVHASLYLRDGTAELASADGVFVERDPAHFARHRDWLAAQLNTAAEADDGQVHGS